MTATGRALLAAAHFGGRLRLAGFSTPLFPRPLGGLRRRCPFSFAAPGFPVVAAPAGGSISHRTQPSSGPNLNSPRPPPPPPAATHENALGLRNRAHLHVPLEEDGSHHHRGQNLHDIFAAHNQEKIKSPAAERPQAHTKSVPLPSPWLQPRLTPVSQPRGRSANVHSDPASPLPRARHPYPHAPMTPGLTEGTLVHVTPTTAARRTVPTPNNASRTQKSCTIPPFPITSPSPSPLPQPPPPSAVRSTY